MTLQIPHPVLDGRKALVVGIANEHSIAWGCAKAFRELGAEVAVTYLNEKALPHVQPLAAELGSTLFLPLDVGVPGQLEAVFEAIKREWGRLDILVHSIAWAPKDDLQGGLLELLGRRLRARDGRLVPLVHPHGAARRTADDRRRHDVRDELLRREPRRAELQRHGPGQGGARGCLSLPRL